MGKKLLLPTTGKFMDSTAFGGVDDPWAKGWNFEGNEAEAKKALAAFGGSFVTIEGDDYLAIDANRVKIRDVGACEDPDSEILILRSYNSTEAFKDQADYLILMRMPGYDDQTDCYDWGFRSDPLPS